MLLWEYCEVAYTPKQIIVHVYSHQSNGMYEGVLKTEEWGTLLAQLGSEGWEMVGVVTAKPANHSLYYFKRSLADTAQSEWIERTARDREEHEKFMKQRALQRLSTGKDKQENQVE